MTDTKIEWCDRTWNVVTGCSPISPGCDHCYAARMANRLRGRCGYPNDEPFRVTFHPNKLDEPLVWRKPQRIFVNSMGDLFHPDVPDEYIAKVWDVMWAAKDHIFLVLTKRPERMKKWVEENAYSKHFGWTYDEKVPFEPGDLIHIDDLWMRNMCGWESAGKCDCNGGYVCGYPPDRYSEQCEHGNRLCASRNCPIACDNPSEDVLKANDLEGQYEIDDEGCSIDCEWMELHTRPRNAYAQNVWLGVTAENRKTWEERADLLKQTLAAVHFVSYEPALGPLGDIDLTGIEWMICGGETGPGARPMHPDWVRSLRDQCAATGTPYFFKQWGEWIDGTQKESLINYTGPLLEPDRLRWMWSDGKTEMVGTDFDRSLNGSVLMARFGKKYTGALLDGQEWRRFPEVKTK